MSQNNRFQAIRESRAYSALRSFSRGIEKGIKRVLNFRRFKDAANEVRKYRDIYRGERCFIIGNGPSLTTSDLDRIKDEFSIASNSIYRLFDATMWRPTIYTAHDFLEIKTTLKEISAVNTKHKIIAQSPTGRVYNIDGAMLIRLVEANHGWKKIPFSDDISQCVYDGGTVTYVNIQIAAYLGFSEIILLGVDHSFAKERKKDGGVQVHQNVRNHFENYQTENFLATGKKDEDFVVFPWDFATSAFESAREYADLHGIRILNATRGGKLEVFERVSFDALDFHDGPR
ncbi:MAG: DUF115 domain-containing protein [Synergistaceae bacterium]|nr:DUF115 domain-containing protein [Synergistaceae bacterium]